MNRVIKKILYIITISLFFFSCSVNVSASNLDYINTNNVVEITNVNLAKDIAKAINEEEKCKAIFGNPEDSSKPAYWFQWVLNAMKYVAIAALIVMSVLDFIKALTSNDKDAVQKASGTTVKRFIYCVLIFFVPMIVNMIMHLLGAYGTCGVG